MMLMILAGTPRWVWGLLVLLVALGLAQARERLVAPLQIVALPLALLALGLWSMADGFRRVPATAAVWALALIALGVCGRWLAARAGAQWLPAQRRLRLPASWLPLALALAIFALRYAVGVSMALHPTWRGQPDVQAMLALLFGALSGLFLGRAWGLLQLTRRGAATMAVDALTLHARG